MKPHQRPTIVLLISSLAGLSHAYALGPEASRPSAKELAPVQVGVKSPPLWLFSKGDKKLIVLGTQLPLPDSGILVKDAIRDHIRRSDVVMTGPGLRAGDGVGLVRGLTMISSMQRAQKNTSGRRLADVLPHQSYERWLALKATYIGRDDGVERKRPMYAAYSLYTAALKRNGMTDIPSTGAVIAKETRDAGLQRLDARYRLPTDGLRKAVKQFDVPLDSDVACMEKTLDSLEANLLFSPAAAEAWSVGDMQRYRDIERRYVPIDSCWARLTNEAMARSSGVADPYGMVESTWLETLHRAFETNNTVFSTLPARDLVDATGLARKLQEDGYSLTALFDNP